MPVCRPRRAYNGSDSSTRDVHLAAFITYVRLFVSEPWLSVHLAAFTQFRLSLTTATAAIGDYGQGQINPNVQTTILFNGVKPTTFTTR